MQMFHFHAYYIFLVSQSNCSLQKSGSRSFGKVIATFKTNLEVFIYCIYIYMLESLRKGLNQISLSCSVPTCVLFLFTDDIDPAQSVRSNTNKHNKSFHFQSKNHSAPEQCHLCWLVMAHIRRNETARTRERSMSWRPPSTSSESGSVMKMIMNSQDASEVLEICSTRW